MVENCIYCNCRVPCSNPVKKGYMAGKVTKDYTNTLREPKEARWDEERHDDMREKARIIRDQN